MMQKEQNSFNSQSLSKLGTKQNQCNNQSCSMRRNKSNSILEMNQFIQYKFDEFLREPSSVKNGNSGQKENNRGKVNKNHQKYSLNKLFYDSSYQSGFNGVFGKFPQLNSQKGNKSVMNEMFKVNHNCMDLNVIQRKKKQRQKNENRSQQNEDITLMNSESRSRFRRIKCKDYGQEHSSLLNNIQNSNSQWSSIQYNRSSKQEQSEINMIIVDLLNKLVSRRNERLKDSKAVIFKHEDVQMMNQLLEHMKLLDSNGANDIFDMVIEILNECIYVNKKTFFKYQMLIKSMVPSELYTELLDYSNLNTLTNCDSMEKILKHMSIYQSRIRKNISEMVKNNNKLQQQIDQQKKEIENYELRIKQLGGLVEDQGQQKQIQELKQELEEKQEIIVKLKGECNYNQEWIKELKEEVLEKEQQIIKLDKENLKYQIQQSDYQVKLQRQIMISQKKTQDFEDFKDKIRDLRYFVENLLIKSKTIQEHFKVLEAEKNAIYNERLELVKRAAAGYENLTPRPNLESICEKKSIEFDKVFGGIFQGQKKKKQVQVIDFKHKKISTEMYFDFLLDKLAQVIVIIELEYQWQLMSLECRLKQKQQKTCQKTKKAKKFLKSRIQR